MIGKMKMVGLTGGIGSGKSTVARLIAAEGVPVLDADQLAREVVVPGAPAHAEIAAAFPEVIDPDGTLNRKRLGARVFADPAARKRLEAIMHPRIAAAAQAAAAGLAAAGHPLAFYEASLLVETGRHVEYDGLVVVVATEEQQIARAMARDGAKRAEVEARLAAQLPLAEKRKVATHIIDNAGSIEATRAQVKALLEKLRS